MTYRKFKDGPQVLSNGASLENSRGSVFSGFKGIGLGLLLGLGLAFVGGRLLSRSQPEPSAAAPVEAPTTAATSVTVQQLQDATIQESLQASGTVEPFDLLRVSPQVSGLQIREVRVREGDQVSTGQVLAVLDDSVLRTQLAQAEANYAQAEAQVIQAQAQLAQAEATAAEAKANFDSYQTLFDQGGISGEELNSRRTQAITARESVGVSAASVQSAEATLQSRDAEIRRLETQLGQTVVTAPASGQIGERQATVGDTSSTSDALFTLVQDGLLELVVDLDLPQRQLANVQVGTPVTVTSSSNEQIELSGRVRSIDPLLDAETRKAAVNVSLESSANLRTGMFLQATFITGQRTGMVLPANAILPQGNNSFKVFTVSDEGTATPVTVTIGNRLPASGTQPERLEILSGLEASSSVIVEGASYLQPGDPVTAVTAPFTEAPAQSTTSAN